MSEPPNPSAAGDADLDAQLRDEVRRITAIRLVGVPRTVVIEKQAVLDGRNVPDALLAKMLCLAHWEAVRFVVIMEPDSVPPELAAVPNLVAQPDLPDPADGTILITCAKQPVDRTTYAWHVGEGATPDRMWPSRYKGPAGTNRILGLYGAGLVQERAGAAFRAAGQGATIPREHRYDRDAILHGIGQAVAPVDAHCLNGDVINVISNPPPLNPNPGASNTLIGKALPAIELACAPSGAIAAAPAPSSTNEPDYWFFWQRDAGQVAVALANDGVPGIETSLAERMKGILRRYVSFASRIPWANPQRTNLTVSRFTVEGSPVVSYGSPQNDGPAHTVLALLSAVSSSDGRQALDLAQPYLDVLVRLAAGATTYDPWEFAVGRIFSTENLIRRALRHGHLVAVRERETARADEYGRAAKEAEHRLSEFYDPTVGYVRAGRDYLIPWLDAMSGLDCSVIGSVLVAYDVTDDFMNVDDPRVFRTLRALEREFIDRWPVNLRWRALGEQGCGFGRFPEDTNDGLGSTGGNPWVVATLWAAQYYLRLIQRLAYQGRETIGEFAKADLLDRAEGNLRFVLTHVGAEAITEQIDGQTGRPRGADRMSWAHAELINTLVIRESVMTNHF